jgi:hypothetical protein
MEATSQKLFHTSHICMDPEKKVTIDKTFWILFWHIPFRLVAERPSASFQGFFRAVCQEGMWWCLAAAQPRHLLAHEFVFHVPPHIHLAGGENFRNTKTKNNLIADEINCSTLY